MTDKPSNEITILEWNERVLEITSRFTAYAVSVAALVESVAEAVTLLTAALDEFTKAQADRNDN